MKHDDLWDFALTYYAQPGVEAACLELQSAGADVCLVLAGVWLERRGLACDEARLRQLKAVSDDWRAQVVAPLRDLRQTWRQQAAVDSDLADLRARVKKLELDAEHIQLRRLQSTAQQWPAVKGPVDWLGRLSTDLNGQPRALIETLRRAAATQPSDEGS